MNALTLLEDLAIALNINNDDLEPYIIKSYLTLRLKPLLGMPGATEQKLNAIANIFSTLYFREDYTLDFLINAVYNYINANGKIPTNDLLNNDIETFLETYANE